MEQGETTKFVTGVVNKGKYNKKVKIATSVISIMLKTGNFHKKFLILIKGGKNTKHFTKDNHLAVDSALRI